MLLPTSPTTRRSSTFSLEAKEAPCDIDIKIQDELRRNNTNLSSFFTSICNLVKSIVGAGVLSLPHGVSVYANDPAVLFPSIFMCVAFCAAATYSFISIGSLCKDTNSKSFRDIWSRVIDAKSGWVISLSITLMCFFSCLTYSIIIGDAFTSLLQAIPGFPSSLANRSTVILLISIFLLLPLCMLRSLHSLTPFSALGIVGSLYTGVFMIIRFSDNSYSRGGQYFLDLLEIPSFSDSFSLYNHSSFVLLSMFSTSFIAHYNAPRFYNELQNPTPQRFAQVTTISFVISTIIFIAIMVTGFLTFGASTQAFVLNNYSNRDLLAKWARVATGLAVITGYPFTFAGFRDGLSDLQGIRDNMLDTTFMFRSIFLLALITGFSLCIYDVSIVVGFSGSLFGTWLLFVVPAVLNIASMSRQTAFSINSSSSTNFNHHHHTTYTNKTPYSSLVSPKSVQLPTNAEDQTLVDAYDISSKEKHKKTVGTWINIPVWLQSYISQVEIILNYALLLIGVLLMIIGLNVNIDRFFQLT